MPVPLEQLALSILPASNASSVVRERERERERVRERERESEYKEHSACFKRLSVSLLYSHSLTRSSPLSSEAGMSSMRM